MSVFTGGGIYKNSQYCFLQVVPKLKVFWKSVNGGHFILNHSTLTTANLTRQNPLKIWPARWWGNSAKFIYISLGHFGGRHFDTLALEFDARDATV